MSLADITKRLALIGGLSLALAGCFQPMYGSVAPGTPGGDTFERLATVEVAPVGGRSGIVLRNDVVFGLTGGRGAAAPAYRLAISYSSTATPVFLDSTGGRPTAQSITVSSEYTLKDLATDKIIRRGTAFSTASVDRSAQRYAAARAGIDAEERAAKAVAEQIITQVAAWLAPGS